MKPNPTLQKISDIILQTIPTFKILLLAYLNKEKQAFSVFDNSYFEIIEPTELNLLVILKNFKGDRHAAVDILEKRCLDIMPVTILLLTTEDIDTMLNQRSPFTTTVIQSSH